MYIAKFSPRESLALRWWEAVIAELRPRAPRGARRYPYCVLFTDAATETNLMEASLFRKLIQAFSIDFWIGRVRPKLNIADLPTRQVNLPFLVGRSEYPLFPPLTHTVDKA